MATICLWLCGISYCIGSGIWHKQKLRKSTGVKTQHMLSKNSNTLIYIVIFIVGALLLIPGLGMVPLFDWDENNFAECAREMVVTGNYFNVQINFEPFWQKPPLFFWLQAACMHIFGINEFAARFPNACVGIATFMSLYYIGNKHFNSTFGLTWVLCYAGSFLPHFYFKSGIIDPVFNLFIFWSIYHLYLLTKSHSWQYAIWAGIFMGLANLTKGPVALLIIGVVSLIYIIITLQINAKILLQILTVSLTSLAVSALWFGYDMYKNGTWFIETFIKYQITLLTTGDAGHGQPVYYHPLVLWIGCFPASIFAMGALARIDHDYERKQRFITWMRLLFWIALIIFSIVKTKIVHYSSVCYFPITFLAALYLSSKQDKKQTFVYIVLAFTGILLALAIATTPYVLRLKEYIIPYIKDPFAVQMLLDAPPHFTGWESVVALFTVFGILYYLLSKYRYKAWVLFGYCIITLQLVFYLYIPKIERIVQGNMIDYFKQHADKDVYVTVLGFKSFAQYFYTKRQPDYDKRAINEFWLIFEPGIKPTYFITKVDRDIYGLTETMVETGRKGGYVFYKRK
ncbi:MAG: glycosyltransferase family 39 protein [Cytophagales bacterium]|nr:glycosyltransferase family 39 protein [Cytophagales bacterium]